MTTNNVLFNAAFSDLENHFSDLEEKLKNLLPSGSGIDCKWEFDYLRNGKVLAKNSYHCMNETGYYCGYADFTVKFSITKSLKAFELQFNGYQAQYLAKKHMLRDYLEDTVYSVLPDDMSIYSLLLECKSEDIHGN